MVVGDWRVIYEVDTATRLLAVITILPQCDAYKQFDLIRPFLYVFVHYCSNTLVFLLGDSAAYQPCISVCALR